MVRTNQAFLNYFEELYRNQKQEGSITVKSFQEMKRY